MQEVQGRLHEARKTQVDDALVPVAAAMSDGLRLLCLDEMQISDIADAMIVGRFFEQVLDAGVVVVTTSNRRPDELYKDGLNRALFLPFIELIETRLSVIELTSPHDYRQDRLEGEKVYFHPADASARTAVERLWNDFLQGRAEPLVLSVKGRKIEIPEFASGVARGEIPRPLRPTARPGGLPSDCGCGPCPDPRRDSLLQFRKRQRDSPLRDLDRRTLRGACPFHRYGGECTGTASTRGQRRIRVRTHREQASRNAICGVVPGLNLERFLPVRSLSKSSRIPMRTHGN